MNAVRIATSWCLIVAAWWCGSAASAEQVGKVEIVKTDIFRCNRLALDVGSTARHGITRMVSAPKGQSFVVIWMDLKVTPGKDEDGDEVTQIDEELIKLTNAKGDAFECVGRCSRDGRYSNYAGSFYSYGKPEKETVPYDMVFLIPEGMQDWTLKMGTASSALQVPPKPEDTIDRTKIATFKVLGVRIVEKLGQELELGGTFDNPIKATETVEANVSRFLAVKLVVKARGGNDSDGDFSMSTEEVGVIYGGAVYCSPIGVLDGDRFYPGSGGFYSEKDAIGEFSAEQVEMVFPLPGKLTKFRLTYLGQKIAEEDIPVGP
jgi:hypothetical protein